MLSYLRIALSCSILIGLVGACTPPANTTKGDETTDTEDPSEGDGSMNGPTGPSNMTPLSPTVLALVPTSGGTIGRAGAVSVRYSKSMNPASLVLGGALAARVEASSWASTTLSSDTLVVSLTITSNGDTGALTIAANDTDGLAAPTQTVSYVADVIAPALTSPTAGNTTIFTSGAPQSVTLVFDEVVTLLKVETNVDLSTVTASDGLSATVTPYGSFAELMPPLPVTIYRCDAVDNCASSTLYYGVDTIRPRVVSTSADGTIDHQHDIDITFDEPIDLASVAPTGSLLATGLAAITGSVDGRTITLSPPVQGWPIGRQTLQVTAADTQGNAMAAPWGAKLGITEPPAVLDVSPGDQDSASPAVDMLSNQPFVVRFTQPVSVATVFAFAPTGAFEPTNPSTGVVASNDVTWFDDGRAARINITKVNQVHKTSLHVTIAPISGGATLPTQIFTYWVPGINTPTDTACELKAFMPLSAASFATFGPSGSLGGNCGQQLDGTPAPTRVSLLNTGASGSTTALGITGSVSPFYSFTVKPSNGLGGFTDWVASARALIFDLITTNYQIRNIFSFDTTAPTLVSGPEPTSGALLGIGASVLYTFSEPVRSTSALTGTLAACVTSRSTVGNTLSLSLSGCTGGTGTLAVTPTDHAGNPGVATATSSFVYDSTVPLCTLQHDGVTVPENSYISAKGALTVVCNEAINPAQASFLDPDFNPSTGAAATVLTSSPQAPASTITLVASPVARGHYPLTIKACDVANNCASVLNYNVWLDNGSVKQKWTALPGGAARDEPAPTSVSTVLTTGAHRSLTLIKPVDNFAPAGGIITEITLRTTVPLVSALSCSGSELFIRPTTADGFLNASGSPSASFIDSAFLDKSMGSNQTLSGPSTISADAGSSVVRIPLSSPFEYDGSYAFILELSHTGCNIAASVDGQLTTSPLAYREYISYMHGAGNTVAGAVAEMPQFTFAYGAGFVAPARRYDAVSYPGVLPTNPHAFASVVRDPVSGYQGQLTMLYYPDEVGGRGRIDAVGLQLARDLARNASDAGVPYTSFRYTLRVGHSSGTTLTGATVAPFDGPFQLTTSQVVAIPGPLEPGEWVSLPFAAPFDYDGVRPLIVQILINTPSNATVLPMHWLFFRDLSARAGEDRLWYQRGSNASYEKNAYNARFRFPGASTVVSPANTHRGAGDEVHQSTTLFRSGSARYRVGYLYQPNELGGGMRIGAIGCRIGATDVGGGVIPNVEVTLSLGDHTESICRIGTNSSSCQSESTVSFSEMTAPDSMPVVVRTAANLPLTKYHLKNDWLMIPFDQDKTFDLPPNRSLFVQIAADPSNAIDFGCMEVSAPSAPGFDIPPLKASEFQQDKRLWRRAVEMKPDGNAQTPRPFDNKLLQLRLLPYARRVPFLF